MKKLLALAMPLLLIQVVHAKDDTLELLAQKGVITAEEYAKIKESRREEGVISLKDGLKITSQDNKSSVQIGTLLQLDLAGFKGDNRDVASGTELRRARLIFVGKYQKDWDFKTEVELAGTVSITDAYASYSGIKPLTITVGHVKNPYSLESLMADKNLTFMERSLSSSLMNPRAPSIMLSSGGDNWSAAVAIAGEQLSNASTDDEGGGFGTRLSYAPLFSSGKIVHLGLSANWRKPTQSNAADKTSETLRLQTKPEMNQFIFNDAKGVAVSQLVSTGNITGNVKNYTLFGLEAAAEYGPFVVQSEYSLAKIARDTKANVSFEGGYLQIAYALTGEARNYRGDKGIFDGFNVSKTGVWELATRYSVLDLNDEDIKGGKEENATIALNWYVNPVVKLSANYIQVLKVTEGAQQDEKPTAVQLRGQVAF